jgi:hypothetical protein
MAVIRPFRALRPDPARASLASLVSARDDATSDDVAGALARDPRHLGRLLVADGGSADAAEFGVVDLVRAGVVRRDALPSLTVARVLADGSERTLLYAALRADDDGLGPAGEAPPIVAVAAAPALVRFVDKKGRIGRAIEAETEREPDASFTSGGASIDVWVVDDESAAARIASLLEGAGLSLVERSARTWGAYRAQGGDGWGLACFVGEDDDGAGVPVGLCLLPLRGPLHLPLVSDG